MIHIEKYRRYFALSDEEGLIALVVYRKGAKQIKERLENLLLAIRERDRYIADLDQRLASVPDAQPALVPPRERAL